MKVVSIAGGTGLSTLLRGLKLHVARHDSERLAQLVLDAAAKGETVWTGSHRAEIARGATGAAPALLSPRQARQPLHPLLTHTL